jgi:GDP-D-mannose dehydratase
MKVAFITGLTGQDGAYLSEFLLKKRISSSWYEKKVFFI